MVDYSKHEVAGQVAYTVAQAARVVGRSQTRIKELIRQGTIGAYREGPKLVLVPRSELERWVASLPVYEPPVKKSSPNVK